MLEEHNSQNVKIANYDKVILFIIITIILSVCAFYITKMNKTKTISVDCEVLSVDKRVETITRNNRKKHEYVYLTECGHKLNNHQYIVRFEEYHPIKTGETLKINVDSSNPTVRKEHGVYLFLLIVLNVIVLLLVARIIYIFIEEKRQNQISAQ